MKLLQQCLFACVLAGGLGLTAMAQAKNPTEEAVLKLEQAYVDGVIKADVAQLNALFADTLVYTHSSGQVDDKTKYIATIKSGATKYLAVDREDIKATVYGDSAVVTCKASLKLNVNGENRAFAVRMIHVYAKVKGKWQMVAHQTTRIS